MTANQWMKQGTYRGECQSNPQEQCESPTEVDVAYGLTACLLCGYMVPKKGISGIEMPPAQPGGVSTSS